MSSDSLLAIKSDLERCLQELEKSTASFLAISKVEKIDEVVVSGNDAGLVRLSIQLLRLAAEGASGSHVTVDSSTLADDADFAITFERSRAPWDSDFA